MTMKGICAWWRRASMKKRLAGGMLLSLLLMILTMLLLYLYIRLTLPDVQLLARRNPQTTAMIELRRAQAEAAGKKWHKRQYWVGFKEIPDLLKKAVRITEDASFYRHKGVDTEEILNAFRKNWRTGRVVRGGSTITQQLAKNLYLSTEKSYWRKIREYFIARELERHLSKKRIFHLYLNVIELGPGIFGVEAASRYYFNRHVSGLNLEQIIRLAAVIPKPLAIKANSKNRWLLWKCRWIVSKLKKYGYIPEERYKATIAKFKP